MTQTDYQDLYEKRCHDAADLWGVMIPGRPAFENRSMPDEYSLYPYIVDRLIYEKDGDHIKAELVHRNGLWGFSWSGSVDLSGHGYGPNVLFCKPHKTRSAAIRALCESVREWLKHNATFRLGKGQRVTFNTKERRAVDWLDSITSGEQQTLF